MENSAEKTENMEVTPATSETQENIPEQPSLAEAVQESKEAISSAEPVKRRGRPRKDPNAPAKEKTKPAEAAKPAPAAIPLPPPVYLKSAINLPYQALAMKTGWAGWELTEKEKEENAVLLDAVLKRYIPQFGSEHPELFALVISLGMATAARYMAFSAIIRELHARAAREQEGGAPEVSRDAGGGVEIRPLTPEKKKKGKQTDPAVKPASALSNFLDNGAQTPTI